MKAEWTNSDSLTTSQTTKAILVIDMPTDCIKCPLADGYCWNTFPTKGKADGCPLKHPLKYVSNDFYIYDTKYLMENLDREIELLKGVKDYESNISG